MSERRLGNFKPQPYQLQERAKREKGFVNVRLALPEAIHSSSEADSSADTSPSKALFCRKMQSLQRKKKRNSNLRTLENEGKESSCRPTPIPTLHFKKIKSNPNIMDSAAEGRRNRKTSQ
ncbi:MAG: hypothetical protein HYU70_16310 [Bacteroidetes bacterium]|nr:hypothetical protein [Bacteroidota bacterium]